MLKRLSEEFRVKRKLARLKRNVLPPQCLRRRAGTFTMVTFHLLSTNIAPSASIILIGSSTNKQHFYIPLFNCMQWHPKVLAILSLFVLLTIHKTLANCGM